MDYKTVFAISMQAVLGFEIVKIAFHAIVPNFRVRVGVVRQRPDRGRERPEPRKVGASTQESFKSWAEKMAEEAGTDPKKEER